MRLLLISFCFVLSGVAYAQVPTPTMYAEATPIVVLDQADYTLWNYTDEAINVWNYFPPVAPVLQIMVILVIVVGWVAFMGKLIQTIMDARS